MKVKEEEDKNVHWGEEKKSKQKLGWMRQRSRDTAKA